MTMGAGYRRCRYARPSPYWLTPIRALATLLPPPQRGAIRSAAALFRPLGSIRASGFLTLHNRPTSNDKVVGDTTSSLLGGLVCVEIQEGLEWVKT